MASNSVRGGARGRGRDAAEETPALPLPLPPRLAATMSSSSPASIRALLARTNAGSGGADCQSPRSLLSRILQRGGGGGDHGGNGSGGGFGCRVRLPRRARMEESKDGAASEKSSDDARVKVVERPAPELPAETPRSSLGRKKPEEELVSMNLGLGASLVLLLSKSAVELNKMVELRAQMEALVSEMRKETAAKEKAALALLPPPQQMGSSSSTTSCSQQSNCGSATTTVIKDPIARPGCAADDTLSDCSVGGGRAVAVSAAQMEAELQVELGRLQMHKQRAAPARGLEVKTKQRSHVAAVDSPPRSCVDVGVAEEDEEEEEPGDDEDEDEEEEEEEEEGHGGRGGAGDNSPPHGGVSARVLERRLHEVLQRRQQERIVELQAALDGAQRRLQEREREVVWWRDAAKLVSHRRDESRRIRDADRPPVRARPRAA
ncbi:protein wings apart-like isoform X2 [Brachypodium distachyon]|uniref:Protein POLAR LOCALIZATION DURING ASYMMETRIC DIVISION AND REDISTRIBUTION n=1 Tax=Brachypodium distachyon TaxID=15368 RepID=A0A0Q3H8D6_BRADI|nr:protein wings apart-like isoform X2 [Brachypodium distachyon]KQK19272.1 hypothetical protein BRADI_1g47330v3 [Brachypodium distachyon]|eukprot:XP_003560993.1 protein wings apart-like isoform X2 [Brachypodium distachyon]